MGIYCIYNESNGLVVNRVVWDGVATWATPAAHNTVESEEGNIGDTYEHGSFIPVAEIPLEPSE